MISCWLRKNTFRSISATFKTLWGRPPGLKDSRRRKREKTTFVYCFFFWRFSITFFNQRGFVFAHNGMAAAILFPLLEMEQGAPVTPTKAPRSHTLSLLAMAGHAWPSGQEALRWMRMARRKYNYITMHQYHSPSYWYEFMKWLHAHIISWLFGK